MVRVFYEPPPFGPGTDLNRTGYGFPRSSSMFGRWIEMAEKTRRTPLMIAVTVAISAICYIPCVNPKLPFTMEPEYQAAQRAYMRYHNMDPIFGISSKEARARDEK